MIVDDEPLARRRVRSLLATDADIEIVGECGDGHSAIATLLQTKPDLLFLDVQMPELDGFDVLQRVPAELTPLTIFVTAYDRYAVKAFEAHAADYLLKPFKRERFFEAVHRAKEQLQAARPDYAEKLSDLLLQLKGGQQRLAVKSAGRTVLLRMDEIDWIEAAANYVRLHVAATEYVVRDAIGAFEKRLPADKFVRIHRSLIVNVDRIRELEPCNGSEFIVVLRNGKELPLGRSYRAHVESCLQLS